MEKTLCMDKKKDFACPLSRSARSDVVRVKYAGFGGGW